VRYKYIRRLYVRGEVFERKKESIEHVKRNTAGREKIGEMYNDQETIWGKRENTEVSIKSYIRAFSKK